MTDTLVIDWSTLPVPQDDGATSHLEGMRLPDIALTSTSGEAVNLAGLAGRVVIYAYPWKKRPQDPLIDGWLATPGAPGCTPQSCAFRDHAQALREAGASYLFGLSTQASAYQREAVERLHLPYPLLSDELLRLTDALRLPTFEAGGMTLIKRLALIVDHGVIAKVFYPVFPPDRNAADVLAWLVAHRDEA
ncbi:peroxiredoxin [Paraburkholderia sp. D15]|uniref:peroxiredoxin n=1 Tax=Paraburkholderia sp. D15 TaxID=2880218 RepID=UPI00247A3F5C|nr:peroxiredoxin [Paraburkholderia sp. D15]WGS53393.1 peroxiredoxin [Paraburkholderia sp. D15]WKF61158.1 Peroxiredoxin Bcp [Paraburkholderia busanensis]